MPIHDGFYFLSAFTLHNRPIGARGHERIRPVIVQAPGTQAHKWYLRNVGDEIYELSLGQLAANVNGRVELVALKPSSSNIQFRWKIIPVDLDVAPQAPNLEIYEILDANSELREGWSVNDQSDEVRVSKERSVIAIDGPIAE